MTAPVQLADAIAEALYHRRYDRPSRQAPPFETYNESGRADFLGQAFVALAALMVARPDHFVTFDSSFWTFEHSMECRLGGEMATCPYVAAAKDIASNFIPELSGRWRITNHDGVPALERVELGA